MNELSKLIRQISVFNNPGESYFDSFLSRYKMYRKTKARKQQILVAATLILLASLVFVVINKF